MIRGGIGEASVISCDVFDTLLKRNAVAEPNRVALIARRAAAMLADRGIEIGADALRHARRDVQHYAYRMLDMEHPTGEVRFAAMIAGMAAILGIGAADAPVLAEAEIETERTQLAPNAGLLRWLSRHAAAGRRVIAISDTWHGADTIRRLLDAVAPGHPVAEVYTSADLDATKRGGTIFGKIAAIEGVAPDRFLHIGDDRLADERMARAAGWRTRRIGVGPALLLRRRLDGARARLAAPRR